jgi:glycosyltransferase involved in cell wall biosynthesis
MAGWKDVRMIELVRGLPSKIVFVNRYFFPDQSATSQLLTDLATAMVSSGLTVHVICSRQLHDDPAARLSALESVGAVTVHRVWTTSFGRARLLGRALDYATFYWSSAFAMLRLLRRTDTVVAKTDPPLISVVAMAAAKLKGAHLVNWLQDIFPEVASLLGANPLPRPIDLLLRRCRDRSLRSAGVNVVLGERMREKLQRSGIPSHQICVIQNWAELDPATPKPVGCSTLRLRVGLSGKFVVCYSGNLGRAHEFHTLLEAADSLRGETHIAFLMIGGGVGMSRLAKLVEERGLTNFTFLPHQPREFLSDALAAADVHWVSLLPDLEGFIVPSKFYGILAAARPVLFVGESDGELAREIRACGCGATVAVGDAASLAQVLEHWKSNPLLCERMGQKGLERYRELYCARRAFVQWERILTQPSRVADALTPAPSRR